MKTSAKASMHPPLWEDIGKIETQTMGSMLMHGTAIRINEQMEVHSTAMELHLAKMGTIAWMLITALLLQIELMILAKILVLVVLDTLGTGKHARLKV